MAEAAILKITKIVISPQQFDRALRNLVRWSKMRLTSAPTVKKLNFKNRRRRTAAILWTVKSPHLRNRVGALTCHCSGVCRPPYGREIASTAESISGFTLRLRSMVRDELVVDRMWKQESRGEIWWQSRRNEPSDNLNPCPKPWESYTRPKKVKVAHTRLAVSLQVTWVINPAVGYHYFPPGPQLPSQPLRGLLPISLFTDTSEHIRFFAF